MTGWIKAPYILIFLGRFSGFLVIVMSSAAIVMVVSPVTTSAAIRQSHTEIRKISYRTGHAAHHISHRASYVVAKPALNRNERHKAAHVRITQALPRANEEASTPLSIAYVITEARRKCRLDPSLLLAIAYKESSFNPKALNRHSSARGLLQFTNTTWLTVIRDFGPRYGLGRYAAAIETDQDGRLTIKNHRLRRAILTLRDDPVLQAIMMAERLEQERAPLELRIGRPATPVDLYFLHMLGPTGAARFLTDLTEHPDTSSLDVVDAVAPVNPGLFVKDGRPRSVAETYSLIRADFDRASSQYPGLVH